MNDSIADEVRPIQRGQARLKEAAEHGVIHPIVPKENKPKQWIDGMEIVVVGRVGQASEAIRG